MARRSAKQFAGVETLKHDARCKNIPTAEGQCRLRDDEIQVRVKGVDAFCPQTGEIESGGTDTIALYLGIEVMKVFTVS